MIYEATLFAAVDVSPDLKKPLLSDYYDPEKELLAERRKFSYQAAHKFDSACGVEALKILSCINALRMKAPEDMLNKDPGRFSNVLFSERYNNFLEKQSAYEIELKELHVRLRLVTKFQYEVESLLKRSKAAPEDENIVADLRRAIDQCQEKLTEISCVQTPESASSGLSNN